MPTTHHRFIIDTVATGLEYPWSVAFLPGGDLLITEKPGRLRVVRNGRLLPQAVAGVPTVHNRGQGGLLDVAVHPSFATNRYVYLSYSRPGRLGRSTTAVVRGRFDGTRLTDVQDILEADAWSGASHHYGSRIAFDKQGMLYITVGDRGEMKAAQKTNEHQGNVLRVHDDGRVPADNPFVNRRRHKPEVYTYGNRNPQGLAVHPVTGAVYITEHGPMGGDELNLLKPGANYGWPVITYGIDYDGKKISDIQAKQGMEQPLHHWVPSIGTSGLMIYHGDKFPNWRGDFFAGGLAGENLVRLRFTGTRKTEVETVLEGAGRVRDVRQGPDGHIYVLIDRANAPLLRLVPR